ncbi:MAG: hypothetical protein II873_02235 [Oscillospiraceae bacterium]|nr:hypothetical protein [Oscillospiraceae bacterium]
MQKKRYSGINSRRAFFATVTACLLLAIVLFTLLTTPRAYADMEDGRKLVVTVVEEIPAEEIEDDDVPLASFTEIASDITDGTRHVLLMGLLLLLVVVYVLYFIAYEKRLNALRWQAAEAENGWHVRHHAERGE